MKMKGSEYLALLTLLAALSGCTSAPSIISGAGDAALDVGKASAIAHTGSAISTLADTREQKALNQAMQIDLNQYKVTTLSTAIAAIASETLRAGLLKTAIDSNTQIEVAKQRSEYKHTAFFNTFLPLGLLLMLLTQCAMLWIYGRRSKP